MKPKTFKATAIAMATAAMLISTGLQAGVIDNSNNTPGVLGACGVDDPATTEIDESKTTACVGAWDLGNVEVSLLKALDGTVFGEFLEDTGFYTALAAGDSFVSAVKDTAGAVVAKVTGKVWPVGEPTGIKAVNGDDKVKEGKPQNCLINTAYLSEFDTKDGVSGFLDMPAPLPVICSSPFQTHKRFKIAMQPATVQVVDAEKVGQPIDLVFNVKDEDSTVLRPYQVFSKINNYTGKQLKGYKIEVGTGTGDAFVPASVAVDGGRPAITDRLQISLGVGETLIDKDGDGPDLPVVGDIFDGDGLATFSHGLFGAPDKHFTEYGFFDARTAGFEVKQSCATGAACPTETYVPTGATITLSDTIYSDAKLPSNYAGPANAPLTAPLFGDWLPAEWAPKGIFFDHDSDPTTDAELQAYWNGTAWIKGFDNTDPALSFVPVSDAEFATWKADARYSIDIVEDVLNLGINYIVKVGDNIDDDNDSTTDSKITIRILPVVADTQVAPSYVDTTPTPLVDPVVPVDPVVTPPTTTDDGGGCSASTSQRPVDPVLPLLAALGLAGWALRRARRS